MAQRTKLMIYNFIVLTITTYLLLIIYDLLPWDRLEPPSSENQDDKKNTIQPNPDELSKSTIQSNIPLQVNIISNPRLKQFTEAIHNDSSLKKIVYWNNWYQMGIDTWGYGQQPFLDAGCPVNNCIVWNNANGKSNVLEQDYDAVLFYAKDYREGLFKRNAPIHRSPHQRYVFFWLESPATNILNLNAFEHFFNWTIAYRRDSDIYNPYGWIGNKSTSRKSKQNLILNQSTGNNWILPDYTNISTPNVSTISSKSNLIAWFVSNFHNVPSNRHIYVKALSQLVPIDEYGARGKFKCPRDKDLECLQMIEIKYKFYLSFENSLCKDYVTEKFFRILKYNIVPIVYGGADYKEFAPPMSYVDVNDYASPKELATYLLYLDNNPVEYEKYFWWKRYYSVNKARPHLLCSLCDMLNDASLPNKVYDNIHKWWFAPNICFPPNNATINKGTVNNAISRRRK